jgi:hypothetical protein
MIRWRGRWSTCENSLSIDVRQLHREGRLLTNQSFPMVWKTGDEACGEIRIETEPDVVILRFRCRVAESKEWNLVEQRIPITWTGCALGGQRPWFLCNVLSCGVLCKRRVAKIYLNASPIFSCRSCLGLKYASQLKTTHLRLIGKAMKIRMQLGGSPNLFAPFPERPKGLHRKNYERLRQIHDATVSRLSG